MPEVAWTEIEYWEAVRRDKARLLYLFEDSPHSAREFWQRHLRSLVELTNRGTFASVKRVRRSTYDAHLQRDLDRFAAHHFQHALVVPGGREPAPPVLPDAQVVSTPFWRAPVKRLDLDALEAGVATMRMLYSRTAYAEALATGIGVFRSLLHFPADEFIAARLAWANFLAQWDRAGSWIGIDGVVPRDMDTLWACRERLRVFALMGRTRDVYVAAGNVAGALYRRGRVKAALYWHDMASRNLIAAGTPAACSTRASMLMALGEWPEAEALLKHSVDIWARNDRLASLVKDLAKLGFIEAKWRKSRAGISRIDEALRIVSPTEHPAFLAQTLALGVQACLAVRDRDAAMSNGKRFVALCQEHHLWHQLAGLGRPLHQLGIYRLSSFELTRRPN